MARPSGSLSLNPGGQPGAARPDGRSCDETPGTQVEAARRLGVGQGVVSRLEHRDDMPLSTLYDYPMATSAAGAGIVVIVHGYRIELDLSRLRYPPEQQSALAHQTSSHG